MFNIPFWNCSTRCLYFLLRLFYEMFNISFWDSSTSYLIFLSNSVCEPFRIPFYDCSTRCGHCNTIVDYESKHTKCCRWTPFKRTQDSLRNFGTDAFLWWLFLLLRVGSGTAFRLWFCELCFKLVWKNFECLTCLCDSVSLTGAKIKTVTDSNTRRKKEKRRGKNEKINL